MRKYFALLILSVLLFVGCKQQVSDFGSEVKITASISEYRMRTALPVYNIEDLTNIVLYGKQSTDEQGEYEQLNAWSGYNGLSNASIKIRPGEWDFKLTGKIGDNSFSDEKHVEITTLQTSVAFELELIEADSSEEGNGSFAITVEYPNNSSNSVAVVTAELLDTNGTVIRLASTLSSTQNSITGKKVATYEISSLPIGQYYAKFSLYYDTQKTVLLNDALEFVRVEKDLCSSSKVVFDSLDNVYEIKLYTNLTDGSSDYVTKCYTKRSGITLPDEFAFTRNSYYFAGWYEDLGYTGEPITAYSKGTTGNKNLYAKWEPGIEYTITVVKNSYLEDGTPETDTQTKWGRSGTITIPVEEFEGFEAGVATPETLDLSDSTSDKAAIIVYDRKNITYTFCSSEDDENPVTKVAKYGAPFTVSDEDELFTAGETHHFEYWTENGYDEIDSLPVTYLENKTFIAYAHEIQNYTISYYTAYGTAPNSVTVPCESTFTSAMLPSISYSGKTFSYWMNQNGNRVYTGDEITSDMQLTAVFVTTYSAPSGSIPLSSSWNVGTLTSSTQTKYYYFEPTTTGTYTVSWGDSYAVNSSASSSYQTVDIKASWYTIDKTTGAQTTESGTSDSGPFTLSVSSTNYIYVVKVVPWSSGNTGNFVIKVTH